MTNNLPIDDQVQKSINQPQSGSIAKEHIETTSVDINKEKVPVVETGEFEKIPEEVESWLEKLEKGEDIKLPQPITDDQGQTLIKSSSDDVQEDQIVLPLSQEKVSQNLHHKINSSARWLAEWCLRLIKKFENKAIFKS